jgi:hypothetical protein
VFATTLPVAGGDWSPQSSVKSKLADDGSMVLTPATSKVNLRPSKEQNDRTSCGGGVIMMHCDSALALSLHGDAAAGTSSAAAVTTAASATNCDRLFTVAGLSHGALPPCKAWTERGYFFGLAE